MKRIIWIFGESATGKLTLINNLYNGDINTLNIFNMSGKKISISEITLEDRNSDYGTIEDNTYYDDSLMEEDNLYFNKKEALQRRTGIMYDTDNFIKSANDILLIKGQVNDMNLKRGNIIGNFLNKYSGLENLRIEAFVLQVTNEEELKRRIESKTWFKELDNEDEKERLIKTIPLKQEKHKEDVISTFSNYDIPIYIIESLTGSYRMEGVINGKSSNIRR